jgi:hypothetical protein
MQTEIKWHDESSLPGAKKVNLILSRDLVDASMSTITLYIQPELYLQMPGTFAMMY